MVDLESKSRSTRIHHVLFIQLLLFSICIPAFAQKIDTNSQPADTWFRAKVIPEISEAMYGVTITSVKVIDGGCSYRLGLKLSFERSHNREDTRITFNLIQTAIIPQQYEK